MIGAGATGGPHVGKPKTRFVARSAGGAEKKKTWPTVKPTILEFPARAGRLAASVSAQIHRGQLALLISVFDPSGSCRRCRA